MSSMDVSRNLIHQYVTISNVDTSRGIITAYDQYNQLVYLSLKTPGAIVRVPIRGEKWLVRRQHNVWYLESPTENGEEAISVSSMGPGDVRAEAPGDLHLNGQNVYVNGVNLQDIFDQLQALQEQVNSL